MYVCMCVCMCVCMYLFITVYILLPSCIRNSSLLSLLCVASSLNVISVCALCWCSSRIALKLLCCVSYLSLLFFVIFLVFLCYFCYPSFSFRCYVSFSSVLLSILHSLRCCYLSLSLCCYPFVCPFDSLHFLFVTICYRCIVYLYLLLLYIFFLLNIWMKGKYSIRFSSSFIHLFICLFMLLTVKDEWWN